MRKLITLDPQNPQVGQQWSDNDGFFDTVYTLTRFDGTNWHYTEERTAIRNGAVSIYENYILDSALRNNIRTDEPRPALTAFDLENIARDLHFEAESARIGSKPVPPMPRLEYDWRCLDCDHVWRGRQHCPQCGADAEEIIDWTP